MKFRFPIVIIDEDFRSENTSCLGIRALAAALEKEGMEVLGVTSYGDLSQFAQQQSRASFSGNLRPLDWLAARFPVNLGSGGVSARELTGSLPCVCLRSGTMRRKRS